MHGHDLSQLSRHKVKVVHINLTTPIEIGGFKNGKRNIGDIDAFGAIC